ncbi:hypothetical protein [Salinimicrobium sediminilitoris]|uniref:hypothetical protein n=1 Tax=Salinimicrobium sediminilitoris TaxID=2876715 RepID=UPI001E2C286F|nr:hypothetical protein [Salinimicrobium sediminilitoris]MCC8359031.1 hypothetical protein [Salinimicrobium sediminilitoris]
MIKKVELNCGVIWVHDRILINEMNEGALLDVETNRKILQIGHDSFNNDFFGYISHRINSYAVNPMVYRESAENPQLKAIAVVSKDPVTRQTALLEQQFYANKNCFKIFSSLEEATAWMFELINSYSNANSVRL